jgi:methionyl-tRNA formyltransferase
VSWRVVICTRIPPVLAGFEAVVREAGHKVVALLTNRAVMGGHDSREVVFAAPEDLDVLLPARRSTIAPLLASANPDLVVCMGFPWKIPSDALAVPRLGWLNGHPSLLPRHRGPIPVAWAIREGDEEIGITFHRMDPELDTGPILAQRRYPLGELEPPDMFFPKMGPVVGEALAEALGRIAAGEEGEIQADEGTYESFFTADDVWLDLSRPAAEVHRLAWSWRYAMAPNTTPGGLLELGGKQVRVLATSLTEVEGARRIECGDAPLWVVETEELSEEAASPTSAQAASTR